MKFVLRSIHSDGWTMPYSWSVSMPDALNLVLTVKQGYIDIGCVKFDCKLYHKQKYYESIVWWLIWNCAKRSYQYAWPRTFECKRSLPAWVQQFECFFSRSVFCRRNVRFSFRTVEKCLRSLWQYFITKFLNDMEQKMMKFLFI